MPYTPSRLCNRCGGKLNFGLCAHCRENERLDAKLKGSPAWAGLMEAVAPLAELLGFQGEPASG